MSEAIVPQGGGAVAEPAPRPEWLKDLAKPKEWLCRVEQAANNSGAVAEGKRQGGNFYFVVKKDQEIDLGREFDAFLIEGRPCAIDFSNQKAGVLNYYDPSSPDFQRVKGLAAVKDSGCMAGPQLLLWIPKIKKFASYLLANATGKQQAGIAMDMRGQWVTFKYGVGRNNKGVWAAFNIIPCALPGEKPDEEAFNAQLHDFLNPKSGPEKDTSEAATADR